jgi:hypothetical protein
MVVGDCQSVAFGLRRVAVKVGGGVLRPVPAGIQPERTTIRAITEVVARFLCFILFAQSSIKNGKEKVGEGLWQRKNLFSRFDHMNGNDIFYSSKANDLKSWCGKNINAIMLPWPDCTVSIIGIT